MEKVKQMVEAGVRLGTAIRENLRPMTLVELSTKHGLPRTSTNEAYNGLRAATPAQVAALVAELGGTEKEWREMLKQARLAAVHAA